MAPRIKSLLNIQTLSLYVRMKTAGSKNKLVHKQWSINSPIQQHRKDVGDKDAIDTYIALFELSCSVAT